MSRFLILFQHKKVTSCEHIIFDMDEKSLYQVCDRAEVLHSFGKIVANMWLTCQKCLDDDCLICDAYYYAFG